jgi:hypothetical protein
MAPRRPKFGLTRAVGTCVGADDTKKKNDFLRETVECNRKTYLDNTIDEEK